MRTSQVPAAAVGDCGKKMVKMDEMDSPSVSRGRMGNAGLGGQWIFAINRTGDLIGRVFQSEFQIPTVQYCSILSIAGDEDPGRMIASSTTTYDILYLFNRRFGTGNVNDRCAKGRDGIPSARTI